MNETMWQVELRGLNEIIVDLRKMLQDERKERELLYAIIKDLGEQLKVLKSLDKRLQTKLSFIKIAIGGVMPVGPATMQIGDKKTATVQGFDQNGAPMAIDFAANLVTWADDNEASVSDSPAADGSDPLTALAAGVMNLAATCAGLTDTETVTVPAAAPVLTTIKVSID